MKKISVLILALLIVALLFSCDGDEPYTEDPVDVEELPWICGNWFIQGVSDSYCLTVKSDETWELRFPGVGGELLASGITEEDPFGGYDLIIDKENNIELGSAEKENNYLMLGVSNSSPSQLEPFGEFYFYAEKDSYPRTSAKNYVGWWSLDLVSSLYITDESNWKVVYNESVEASGTYTVADDGITMTVVESSSLYFQAGEMLTFKITENGALNCPDIYMTMVPAFDEP